VYPDSAFEPNVVSLTIGLFSFSLFPIRDMAPRDEARSPRLLDLSAVSIFLERAFNGPEKDKITILTDCSCHIVEKS